MVATNNINITLVNDVAEFAEMKKPWNTLLSRSSADNIFLTWEFCHTWWHAFGEDKELVVIAAYLGDDLVGIAPLCRTRSRQFGLIPRCQLEFIGGSETFFEGLDFILAPEMEHELLSRFVEYLYSDKCPQWALINLTACRETSKVLPQLIVLLESRKSHHGVYAIRDCVVVKFPEKFEEYPSTLNKKNYKNIKNYSNRLFKIPEVFFECIDSPLSLGSAFKEFIGLHQSRQNAMGNEGSFRETRANYLKFHNELLSVIGPLAWVFIAFIRAGDKPIAGRYAYKYHDTLYAYSIGFDPEWAKYRPGNVLTFKAFEHLVTTDRVRQCDFLRGVGPHKLQWSKNTVKSYDFVIWRNRYELKRSRIESKLRTMLKHLLPKKIKNIIYERFFENENS